MNKIYIHGLGQTNKSWNWVINEMNDINGNCPDLKNLLGLKDVTFDNLYDEFSKYCNEFSGELDLCGISLGGMLALKYAIDNPEKVNSLVLIATQYKIPKLLFAIQGAIFKCLPNSAFRNTGFTKKDFFTLTSSMKNINLSNNLSIINCKTLVICGEKDVPNRKATIELNKLIKDSKMTYIRNSGHEVNVDEPKQLAKTLKVFYDEIL